MSDPDLRRSTQGGGCLMLFGAPFFTIGLFLCSSPLWGPLTDKRGQPTPAWAVVPFGMVFAAVGAALVLGRRGVILDRRARTITTWWGLLVPFKSKHYALEEFPCVTVSRETRNSKNSTYVVFPVRLENASVKVELGEFHVRMPSRRLAEETAKFLGLGLRDLSTGEEIVREAGNLDESLRQQLARTGERSEMPRQPEHCRTRHAVHGAEAVFEIPPPGMSRMPWFAVALPLGFSIFLVIPISQSLAAELNKPLPDLLLAAFLGCFLFGVVSAVLGLIGVTLLRTLATRERLIVSSRGLHLERISPLLRKSWTIPADELEELEVVPASSSLRSFADALNSGSTIIAYSDRTTLHFGTGLPEPEVQWLQDVVRFLVTAPTEEKSI